MTSPINLTHHYSKAAVYALVLTSFLTPGLSYATASTPTTSPSASPRVDYNGFCRNLLTKTNQRIQQIEALKTKSIAAHNKELNTDRPLKKATKITNVDTIHTNQLHKNLVRYEQLIAAVQGNDTKAAAVRAYHTTVDTASDAEHTGYVNAINTYYNSANNLLTLKDTSTLNYLNDMGSTIATTGNTAQAACDSSTATRETIHAAMTTYITAINTAYSNYNTAKRSYTTNYNTGMTTALTEYKANLTTAQGNYKTAITAAATNLRTALHPSN